MLLILDGFERVAGAAVWIATSSQPMSETPPDRHRPRLASHRRREGFSGRSPGMGHGRGRLRTDRRFAAVRFSSTGRGSFARFRAHPRKRTVVRELVERLDGCPLAIELAAARARLLPPEVILDRLEAVLDLSTSSPELPTRQRSLRATIEWSHGLLNEADQRLFRRFGVFINSWSLEAAEAVAGDSAPDMFLELRRWSVRA